jgi:SAM-dependent methyltransferase
MATPEIDPLSPALPVTGKVDIPPLLAPGPAAEQAVAEHFEEVYRSANGEAARVPWADGCPHPLLVSWLNGEARRLVRPGCRAVVVGCGLGDDVVELAQRGYDVVGFDVSPTAVRWAALRHPGCAERFAVANLLACPGRLTHRFDLVVEVYTIQSMRPELRAAAVAGIAALATPRGVVVTIARARDAAQPLCECVGPPWPLTAEELIGLFAKEGLSPLHGPCGVEESWDKQDPPKRRLCGAFVRYEA